MRIVACNGFGLEKEKPNSPEEFFNRSVIEYIKDGEEKTLNVLYLRYFDEMVTRWTPYPANPLFKSSKRDIYMADIIAMVCLLKDPSLVNRKRVYINAEKELAGYFENIDFEKLEKVFISIDQAKPYDIESHVDYYIQS
ncbi:hypothetical protein QUF94_10295 [Peribacillus sp. NJ4]|uniref:hypothetical protein n=1 Tax=Peribacillus TaxID=2675229 RepID=UPI0025A0DB4D|nr:MULTISPECIES: hypothetical protein [unclassified Peribacillus]MDM5211833.1 hypothetical protein [Peribacillus sp. NJ4]MDM5222125.1 hypothetical protein [Peribacillus sp. NJ11]